MNEVARLDISDFEFGFAARPGVGVRPSPGTAMSATPAHPIPPAPFSFPRRCALGQAHSGGPVEKRAPHRGLAFPRLPSRSPSLILAGQLLT